MPRVLLVFEPPDGGVAESALHLARGLGARGWRAHVAGPASAAVAPAIREAGIPYHPTALARGFGRPGLDVAALTALRRTIRDNDIDLVHALSSKAGVLARLAAVSTRTPWVYSPHCFAFVGPVGWARQAFGLTVELALGRAGTGLLLCVSEDERREALSHRIAPPRAVHAVHNGVPPCGAVPEPDPELAALAAEGPLAATLCVLRKQKGVERFLAAAPRILAEVPDARLAVIGDGPELGRLEHMHRELGLGDHVRLLPFRAPPARQLQSLDVFVLPSLWEAFPFSVLEAMACGVPQVVTDVGGTTEAVLDGETGLVVAPGDVDALAAAVVALLGDPQRRSSMGEASRERHAARFGLDAMLDGTARVYDELAGRDLRAATT